MRAHLITDRLQSLARTYRRSLAEVAEIWDERAAIREYEGGMRRADAERDALADVENILGMR